LGTLARMHRTLGSAGVIVAALLAASPAAAQSRCTAPEKPGWHSCLTASSRAIDDGEMVRLTTVRPRLVVRYKDGCPAGADRRTVAIRTGDGDRLVRERDNSRCRRGVARYDVKLRLDVDLPAGTVLRSYWTGIPDADKAPAVTLTA
jgi:hypothetical protein